MMSIFHDEISIDEIVSAGVVLIISSIIFFEIDFVALGNSHQSFIRFLEKPETWLANHGSLIAGIMAVVAAYSTIKVMRDQLIMAVNSKEQESSSAENILMRMIWDYCSSVRDELRIRQYRPQLIGVMYSDSNKIIVHDRTEIIQLITNPELILRLNPSRMGGVLLIRSQLIKLDKLITSYNNVRNRALGDSNMSEIDYLNKVEEWTDIIFIEIINFNNSN